MTSEPKNEASLQSQIVNLLRLKGIEPLWHRTDKRSTGTVGWPDITFHVCTRLQPFGCGCLWEVKMPKGKLSVEQEAMQTRLTSFPNDWRYRVIRSLDEAIQELKEMGA